MEPLGVVHDESPRLVVDAGQCERWPRRSPVRMEHTAPAAAVVVVPMRADTAAALVEARALGKRYYLVRRD
jgi:hypothetical protein